MKWTASLTVNDSLGKPVAGAAVTATDISGDAYSGTTDSNGVARLTLAQYIKTGNTIMNCGTPATTNFTPYSITASKNGFSSSALSFQATAATSFILTLTGYVN